MYQSVISYGQWVDDHSVRTQQAKVAPHLSEAIKALSAEKSPAVRIAGFYSFSSFRDLSRPGGRTCPGRSLWNRREAPQQTRTILASGDKNRLNAMDSIWSGFSRRSVARAASRDENIRGDLRSPTLAILSMMALHAVRRLSVSPRTSRACLISCLIISDLRGSNLRVPDMTQSHFRRTGLAMPTFKELGSVVPALTIGRPQVLLTRSIAANRRTKRLSALVGYTKRKRRGDAIDAGWQTLERRRLGGANFTNAGLAGANFSEADLTGAAFNGANISRANFRKAKVLPKQLEVACADEQPLHDFSITIKKCKCREILRQSADVILRRVRATKSCRG